MYQYLQRIDVKQNVVVSVQVDNTTYVPVMWNNLQRQFECLFSVTKLSYKVNLLQIDINLIEILYVWIWKM